MKHALVLCLFCVVFALVPAAFSVAQDQQEGNATWYDTDTPGLHASHSRLPLGTRLRVTNLENDKQVYVTINNRIPSMPDRILDLSREAARKLDLADTGTTPVRLEVVKEEVPPPGVSDDFSFDSESPAAAGTDTFIFPEDDWPSLTDIEKEAEPELAAETPPDVFTEEPSAPAITVAPPAAVPVSPPPVRTPLPAARTPVPPPPPPVRTPPPAAPPVQAAPAASGGDSLVTIKVIVTVNGQEHVMEIPNVSAKDVNVKAVQETAPSSGGVSAKIVPKMPDPRNGRTYRVQVGAFASTAFAQDYFDRLKAAGYRPAFERNGNLYRVVVTGIKAADMEQTARRLGAAGFREAWIREEN
ncbi:MAG: SPOR domain-containing protein [Treponema sp.]|jgi:hypothetical protein|nr:SPOR domain-containing protein [Treponema sp.]